MKFLDSPLPTPAENLAADEALLDWCEAGAGAECLWFWEPREPFADVLFGDGLRGAAVRVHQRVAIGYAVERTLFM